LSSRESSEEEAFEVITRCSICREKIPEHVSRYRCLDCSPHDFVLCNDCEKTSKHTRSHILQKEIFPNRQPERKKKQRPIRETRMLHLENGRNGNPITHCGHCRKSRAEYKCLERDCQYRYVCNACEKEHPAGHVFES